MYEVAGHQAPFTVYYAMAIPNQAQLQSRWERLRYAGKVSRLLYSTLSANASLTMAQPGGSSHSGADVYTFTDVGNGMQFKPQFGETPAQLELTGFYALTSNLVQSYANESVFLGNRALPGPINDRSVDAIAIPVASITAEVVALKAILDAAAASVLAVYADCALRTFRLDYKAIIWGDRGFSFPQ